MQDWTGMLLCRVRSPNGPFGKRSLHSGFSKSPIGTLGMSSVTALGMFSVKIQKDEWALKKRDRLRMILPCSTPM